MNSPVDPLTALIVAALLTAVALFIVWPERGLHSRWSQLRRVGDRAVIEDALKHLFHCDYALRIVRVHRLWEQHLAEETGLGHASWHGKAEREEHRLSADDDDQLDQRMGYPVYDPHGDPIPTASGQVGPRQGYPITNLQPAQLATIAHLEDEPEEIYTQLIDSGLHLGMQVEVHEITDDIIRFLGDGQVVELSPTVAANVFVVPRQTAQEMEGAFELRSPVGDPTAYRVRGAMIALRREQADQVLITRLMEAA